MDASRYFEEMHRAMSAQKNNSSLLLTVKVQDLGGADAYLELRQSPNGRARVFYSTMGRRNLNFQLFRKGWQLCHNASGEMTGQFPTRAENLLDSADFFRLHPGRCPGCGPYRDHSAGAAPRGRHLLLLPASICPGRCHDHRGELCGPGRRVELLVHPCRRLPAHCGNPLLAGRFSGRNGAPHPAIQP